MTDAHQLPYKIDVKIRWVTSSRVVRSAWHMLEPNKSMSPFIPSPVRTLNPTVQSFESAVKDFPSVLWLIALTLNLHLKVGAKKSLISPSSSLVLIFAKELISMKSQNAEDSGLHSLLSIGRGSVLTEQGEEVLCPWSPGNESPGRSRCSRVGHSPVCLHGHPTTDPCGQRQAPFLPWLCPTVLSYVLTQSHLARP